MTVEAPTPGPVLFMRHALYYDAEPTFHWPNDGETFGRTLCGRWFRGGDGMFTWITLERAERVGKPCRTCKARSLKAAA